MIPLFLSLVFLERERSWPLRKSVVALFNRCGALVGLAGGLLSGVFGSALIAASWLMRASTLAISLHQIGSASLLITIPLLLLGGFCLDGIEPDSAGRNR
jgi:hypothetical protein